MTNKLPKIGTKYKYKRTQEILILERVQTIKNHKWYFLETDDGVVIAASTYQFKNDYESFNEQEDKQEKIMQAHAESGKFGGDKVEDAKEELKRYINTGSYYAYDLKNKAQNLLNALDTQKELEESAIQSNIVEPHKRSSLICTCGNKQESVYPAFIQIKDLQCGKCSRSGYLQLQNENAKMDSSFWEGNFCSAKCAKNEDESKSIWKDVSELPHNHYQPPPNRLHKATRTKHKRHSRA
jgi:hypothetical protein